MKNQYFGDINDFHKYDLALSMMQACSLRTFTFVVMLTKDGDTGDGDKTSYECGARAATLYAFLRDRVLTNRRAVRELGPFLGRHGIHSSLLLDDISEVDREKYFAQIGEEQLQTALIFLDPDNGLEVPSTRPGSLPKYVRYSEVLDLYTRMSYDSLLMVYQHFPHMERQRFFDMMAQRIRERVGPLGCACYAPDEAVAYFFLSKDDRRKEQIAHLLPAYHAKIGAAHCLPNLI